MALRSSTLVIRMRILSVMMMKEYEVLKEMTLVISGDPTRVEVSMPPPGNIFLHSHGLRSVGPIM